MVKVDNTYKKLDTAIKELTEDYYCLAPILQRFQFKESKLCPTAAVDYYGRGIYNKEFIDERSPVEIKGIILHEAMHILLKHIKRFIALKGFNSFNDFLKSKDKKAGSDFEAFNIAADAVINDNIINETNCELPDGSVTWAEISKLTKEKICNLKKMSTEEVYELVRRNYKPRKVVVYVNNGQGARPGSPQQQQQPSSSNGELDKITKIEKVYKGAGKNTQDIDDAANEAKRRIANASDSKASKNRGSSDNAEIKDSLKHNNFSWKKVLRSFTDKVAGKTDRNRNWRRPSRKYRDIYPISQGKARNKQKDLIFSIDVSGSMNADKIARVISSIDNYIKQNGVNGKYFFFSNNSSDLYDLKNIEKFKKDLLECYGGGTDYTAALRADREKNFEHNGLVIISDLCFFTGENIQSIEQWTKNNFVFINVEPIGAHNDFGAAKIIKDTYKDTEHYAEYF